MKEMTDTLVEIRKLLPSSYSKARAKARYLLEQISHHHYTAYNAFRFAIKYDHEPEIKEKYLHKGEDVSEKELIVEIRKLTRKLESEEDPITAPHLYHIVKYALLSDLVAIQHELEEEYAEST